MLLRQNPDSAPSFLHTFETCLADKSFASLKVLVDRVQWPTKEELQNAMKFGDAAKVISGMCGNTADSDGVKAHLLEIIKKMEHSSAPIILSSMQKIAEDMKCCCGLSGLSADRDSVEEDTIKLLARENDNNGGDDDSEPSPGEYESDESGN